MRGQNSLSQTILVNGCCNWLVPLAKAHRKYVHVQMSTRIQHFIMVGSQARHKHLGSQLHRGATLLRGGSTLRINALGA